MNRRDWLASFGMGLGGIALSELLGRSAAASGGVLGGYAPQALQAGLYAMVCERRKPPWVSTSLSSLARLPIRWVKTLRSIRPGR